MVLDTDATGWLLDPRPLPQAENIRSFLGDRARVVSFVTVTELRYGALRAGWGQLRLRGLERSLGDLEVIQTNESLVGGCAELRNEAARIGHPLGQKVHEADRLVREGEGMGSQVLQILGADLSEVREQVSQ